LHAEPTWSAPGPLSTGAGLGPRSRWASAGSSGFVDSCTPRSRHRSRRPARSADA
jgi:hypothetical protein